MHIVSVLNLIETTHTYTHIQTFLGYAEKINPRNKNMMRPPADVSLILSLAVSITKNAINIANNIKTTTLANNLQ